MGAAFILVWGVALLVIVVLLVVLMQTLKRGASPSPTVGEGEALGSIKDTLLFYYAEQSVRNTSDNRVIVRISGIAWDTGWQEDLIRLEVNTQEPESVVLPPEWADAQILAVYNLCAYRMTEMGTDVEVERFAAPVDVFLTTEGREPQLRFGVRNETGWVLAPFATLSPEALGGAEIPAEQSWAAASIAGMRDICLVR